MLVAPSAQTAQLPLYISRHLPATFVDSDLIRQCMERLARLPSSLHRHHPSYEHVLLEAETATALLSSLTDEPSSSAIEAALDANASRLRESAFPGSRHRSSLVLASVGSDPAAAIVATLGTVHTVGQALRNLLTPRWLHDCEAAPCLMATHLVHSSAWSTECGGDLAAFSSLPSPSAGDTGCVRPGASYPLSRLQRRACRIWQAEAESTIGGAEPAVPWLEAVQQMNAAAASGEVFARGTSLGGPERLLATRQSTSLQLAEQVFTLEEALSMCCEYEDRLPPATDAGALAGVAGAAEALALLAVARRLQQVMAWIAREGGPTKRLTEAMAPGSTVKRDIDTRWAVLASRALRPEGVLVTLPGRGHNESWPKPALATVSIVGQRLGWLPGSGASKQ
jgi:hypothetical protein